MLKFTRISSLYPDAVKLFKNKIYKKKFSYKQLLNEVFKFGFGEKDNISKELLKKDYECNEIVANVKTLQSKWLEEFLGKKNDKDILIKQISYFKSNIVYFGNYSFLNKKFIQKLRKLDHIKLIIVFHCSPLTKKIQDKLKLADIIITCTNGYYLEIKKKITKKNIFSSPCLQCTTKNTTESKKKIY